MRLCSGQTWPPARLGGYQRFFVLRSLLAVSSVAFGRIEFVLWTLFGPSVYGLSVYFQLLSTSPRGDAVTFSFWRKLHQRGTFTLLRTLTPKRTSADSLSARSLLRFTCWAYDLANLADKLSALRSAHTLNLNSSTSPSFTTYSLPSMR